MRVWLLHVSEELPLDGSQRMFRYGYLADALQQAGHQVLRWAPTFRHRTKEHRFDSDTRYPLTPAYEIQFVHSRGYRRHIGLARLQAYRQLASRFRELASRESLPDLIVAAIPSLEWAEAAVELGHDASIPVVIDIRDIWPDIYLNALPTPARRLGRLLLKPQFERAKQICRGATMLSAVSQSYLDWALKLAERPGAPTDYVLPLGYERAESSPEVTASANQQLHSLGVDLRRPICLFAGRLERSYDLDTVIHAARQLAISGRRDLQFVCCGGGSRLSRYRRAAAKLDNVFFPGWVDAPTLQAIADQASIGLCAYAADATQSVPNKPFEYMASKLAIVSSLPGDMQHMLARYDCGVSYLAGDADSLSTVLTDLVDAPERLAEMKSNGYQAWRDHYQSRSLYAEFVAHLERVSTVKRVAA